MRAAGFLAILSAILVFSGCDRHPKKDGGVPPPRTKESPRGTKVYIDTVPAGAEVFILSGEKDSKEESLGFTPLVVDASKCPSMKFWIKMDMDGFLKKVEEIPIMKDWVAMFKSERYFGHPSPLSSQEYFDYEVALSRNVAKMDGGLVATGPVQELDWPRHNRMCVLFIPKGIPASAFYPLMPKPGTFTKMEGSWPKNLKNKYKLSEAQAAEAMECMTRCGKYRARVKDPFRENIAIEYSFTAQGPPTEDLIVIQGSEVRIIPGYND